MSSFKKVELYAHNVRSSDMGPQVAAVNPARFHAAFAGPVNITGWTDVKINGFNFGTPNPSVVLVQTRFPGNNGLSAPDNFSILVTETSQNHIRFNVWRVDNRADPAIDYRFDILVVE
jgi:hypothetical protein